MIVWINALPLTLIVLNSAEPSDNLQQKINKLSPVQELLSLSVEAKFWFITARKVYNISAAFNCDPQSCKIESSGKRTYQG